MLQSYNLFIFFDYKKSIIINKKNKNKKPHNFFNNEVISLDPIPN
jgi:phosphatidylglycerophosphatase A